MDINNQCYRPQKNNKVMEYNSNKTVNLYKMERSMEEAVFIFQSVIEVDQRNGGPNQKRPLEETKNLPEGQTMNR